MEINLYLSDLAIWYPRVNMKLKKDHNLYLKLGYLGNSKSSFDYTLVVLELGYERLHKDSKVPT
jgi:hypothetical protein